MDSKEAAVEAVRWYAARGFWGIKLYNSMRADWNEAAIAEAHRLGMKVHGHIPAFSTADAEAASVAYWRSVNGLPLPDGASPPPEDLAYYKSLTFPYAPGN